MMKMSVKKTIAIVGATEKTGKIIAEKFSSLPYRLCKRWLLGSRYYYSCGWGL
jgi:hypothetical protein